MNGFIDWFKKNGAALTAFAGATGTLLHEVYPQFASAVGEDASAVLIVATVAAAAISAFGKGAEGDDNSPGGSGGTDSGGDNG